MGRADTMIKDTGRASVGDGWGRLCNLQVSLPKLFDTKDMDLAAHLDSLVEVLERDMDHAERNLTSAVASAPLHARFIALRYAAFSYRRLS